MYIKYVVFLRLQLAKFLYSTYLEQKKLISLISLQRSRLIRNEGENEKKRGRKKSALQRKKEKIGRFKKKKEGEKRAMM